NAFKQDARLRGYRLAVQHGIADLGPEFVEHARHILGGASIRGAPTPKMDTLDSLSVLTTVPPEPVVRGHDDLQKVGGLCTEQVNYPPQVHGVHGGEDVVNQEDRFVRRFPLGQRQPYTEAERVQVRFTEDGLGRNVRMPVEDAGQTYRPATFLFHLQLLEPDVLSRVDRLEQ